MKALLLTAPSRLELADLDLPAVGVGEVRIRIAACGIRGSGLHAREEGLVKVVLEP
jgi:threonine dehydrogenase-like Zn-dependent dehydrogenase